MAKILFAEDDLQFAGLVKDYLTHFHHVVDHARDGNEALELIDAFSFQLLILDWDLPGKTGIDIISKRRTAGDNVPILMLTAKGEIDAKEEGFAIGADDYLAKPIDLRELLARVNALLRRTGTAQQTTDVLKFGAIELNARTRVVTRNGETVALLPREFALIEFLVRNRKTVFTAQQLLDGVWSSESDVTEHAVRVCVNRIRSKLDTDGQPSVIKTIYSVGYTVEGDS